VRLGKALYVSLGVGVSILVALGFAYLVNSTWKQPRSDTTVRNHACGRASRWPEALLPSTDPPKTDTDDESDYSFQSAEPSHFESTRPPWPNGDGQRFSSVGLRSFEMWWPGTELNRRRQPFQRKDKQ
jgi:hypothetical protein